jgi:hypothetical protein
MSNVSCIGALACETKTRIGNLDKAQVLARRMHLVEPGGKINVINRSRRGDAYRQGEFGAR